MNKHKKLRKKLDTAIDIFLRDYREAETGGGYAKVTWEDFHQLHEIINRLVELKCQTDADGDRPMWVHLTNRRVHVPNFYTDVPYDHKSPSKEVLQALLSNLETASGQMDTFLRCYDIDKLPSETE